ncbi:hypothetical protein F7734_55175, partial [Scytonema sp. UIC 10036]|uniref:hypothetical protein n=1 Tax=Scytonema sp. UIC 10036 TaxID=2304196 RepID=UPI0013844E0C
MATLQDFSLIKTTVRKYAEDFGSQDYSNAFYHLILELILDLQDDEIEDSITDNHYLRMTGKSSGHDQGIDAVYIESNGGKPRIHLFNCKYTNESKKMYNNYP